MSKIICLADGVPFDSKIMRTQPLGGAETACVRFMESLAEAGHEVTVYNSITAPHKSHGVNWAPISAYNPQSADVVFSHRTPHLLSKHPVFNAKKILYVHNPTDYLKKWKHRKEIYKHKPDIVFSGHYHASTWPKWMPKHKKIIVPYAVDDIFLTANTQRPPPPKAIFISNPLRSLDWLLDVWSSKIHTALPSAELHLYCGPGVYPGLKPKTAKAMQTVLDLATSLKDKGIITHTPLPRHELIKALETSRVMLYRGDLGESFCLSLAEAQALGIPAVIQDIGACKERIIPNETGYVAQDKSDFAAKAIALLSDDTLWLKQHKTALEKQRQYTWSNAAALMQPHL